MTARALLILAAVCATACRPAPTQPPVPPTAEIADAQPGLPPSSADPDVSPASGPEAEPEPEPEPVSSLAKEIWTAQTVPPLSTQEHETFWGTEEDPAPQVRGGIVKELEDVHYTIGNEWTLYAFREDIHDAGGGYVGVGPDQAYLFIGWQRPHLAWLIDYDAAVLRTHALYKAIFAAAPSPAAFVDFFEPDRLQDANAAIDAMYEDKEARSLKALLRRQRRYYRYRLRTLKKHLRGVDVPTYLTDQATYDYVKAMLAAQRVRPMLVNLNAPHGMAGLSKAARALKVPIRVLYVSNAEEYWERYEPQFIANVEGLYSDETSVLLRTRLTWKLNRDYMYIAQPLDLYRAWLKADGVSRVRDILLGHPPTQSDEINHWRHERAPSDVTPADARP